MKNLIICNFPIGPKFNGGSMTVWGLVSFYLDNKENLNLFLICSSNQKNSDQYNECISILNKNNLNYKIFYYNEKKINVFKKLYNFFVSIIFGKPNFFFPHHKSLKDEIEKKINELKFNQIICYHFDALSSCYDLKNLKLLLGDFIHEPRIYRRLILNENLISKFINYFEIKVGFRVMKKLTKKADFVGFFSKNYADIFNNQIKKSFYLKTPIVDLSGFDLNQDFSNNLNLLMIGHLKGTVTISSLIFLEKLIKKYEKKMISLNVKINIVGGNALNQRNNFLLYKKNLIKFHGESFDINDFFLKNNYLLVPNEIDVGIRVRIITGLSFGAVILTHKSNLKGIPELKNNFNCLIFSNEHEFLEILIRIKSKKINFDFIRQNAIKTFKDNFYYKNSVKEIIKKINNAK